MHVPAESPMRIVITRLKNKSSLVFRTSHSGLQRQAKLPQLVAGELVGQPRYLCVNHLCKGRQFRYGVLGVPVLPNRHRMVESLVEFAQ